MCDGLLVFGFPMKRINASGEPIDFAKEGLHVNHLALIVIVIKLWLALKLIPPDSPHLTSTHCGITLLLSDDTSAISWMCVAGKYADPGTHCLAPLASALLVHSLFTANCFFQTCCVPGKQNNKADCLSGSINLSICEPGLRCRAMLLWLETR